MREASLPRRKGSASRLLRERREEPARRRCHGLAVELLSQGQYKLSLSPASGWPTGISTGRSEPRRPRGRRVVATETFYVRALLAFLPACSTPPRSSRRRASGPFHDIPGRGRARRRARVEHLPQHLAVLTGDHRATDRVLGRAFGTFTSGHIFIASGRVQTASLLYRHC